MSLIPDSRTIQLDELFTEATHILDDILSELDRKDLATNRAEWVKVRVTQAQMATTELKELL